MTGADLATGILLAAGCGTVLLSVAGVLFARDSYERIHYMGPAATLGISSVTAAVLVRESFNQAGLKAILIALILILANAVSSHAIARANRIEKQGSVRLRAEEKRRRMD